MDCKCCGKEKPESELQLITGKEYRTYCHDCCYSQAVSEVKNGKMNPEVLEDFRKHHKYNPEGV